MLLLDRYGKRRPWLRVELKSDGEERELKEEQAIELATWPHLSLFDCLGV